MLTQVQAFVLLCSVVSLPAVYGGDQALEERSSGLADGDRATRSPSHLYSRCKYSCPSSNMAGTPLTKKGTAFGWDFDGYTTRSVRGRPGKGATMGKGWYDVFECVYNIPSPPIKERVCSYYKHDGTQALGYPDDLCPPQAPACPEESLNDVSILGVSSYDASSASPPHKPVEAQSQSASHHVTPDFSSSQLDGAELLDAEKGFYKYRESVEVPPWVVRGRDLLYLKENPPAKVNQRRVLGSIISLDVVN